MILTPPVIAFACTHPGCKRSFSVVSNAKRHMRTHGVGVRIEDHHYPLSSLSLSLSSEERLASSAVPYVVGFETPVIVSTVGGEAEGVREPVRLRWVASASSTPGSGSGSGSVPGSVTPSTGSSRARSLSGAASPHLGPMVDWQSNGPGGGRYSTSTSSEMDGYEEEQQPRVVDSGPPWREDDRDRDREWFSDSAAAVVVLCWA